MPNPESANFTEAGSASWNSHQGPPMPSDETLTTEALRKATKAATDRALLWIPTLTCPPNFPLESYQLEVTNQVTTGVIHSFDEHTKTTVLSVTVLATVTAPVTWLPILRLAILKPKHEFKVPAA